MVATPQNWLPHYIKAAKLNPNKLASLTGENRQTLYKLVKRPGALPTEWAEKLAPHLRVSPSELSYGPVDSTAPVEASPAASAEVRSLPSSKVGQAVVVGRVACGVWLADDHVDGTVYAPVPVVLARYPEMEQFAYLVTGPSMDRLRIFDGDFVITVPYWAVRIAPVDEDVVVVERRRGGLVERTCKQVEVKADRVELWPRSTHEGFQTPLVVPRNRNEAEDGTEVEIVGLVIGRHTVM